MDVRSMGRSKKNLRRISETVTAYNLQRLADMDKTSPGRVVDKVDRDIRLALLGDHEAAKRLTEAGVLVACCCGDDAHIKHDRDRGYKVCCGSLTCGNETLWWGDKGTAIRVWNTRAPILSAEEMEMLHGKENP